MNSRNLHVHIRRLVVDADVADSGIGKNDLARRLQDNLARCLDNTAPPAPTADSDWIAAAAREIAATMERVP